MNIIRQKLFSKRLWSLGLFWSWNVIFLAFMLLGFAPTVLPELRTAVVGGLIPSHFLLYGAVLVAIPLLAVIAGLTLLRRRPERLFVLGYGVEGPLMLILAVRFFVIQQVTTAVTLLLVVAGLGILTYLWQILDRHSERRGPLLTHLRLAGLTLLLLTGLYASIWLAFYALPLGVEGLKGLGGFLQEIWRSLWKTDWRVEWRMLPFILLGAPLLIYSATLFVLMPIAISILYTRAWWLGFKQVMVKHGRFPAVGLVTAVIILVVAFFIQTNRQPQQAAFALLETPPASHEEALTLRGQEELIRAGLLNAFLAPRRYLSAAGEVRHISQLYRSVFDLRSEQARQVEKAYELVASPLLYQPVKPAAVGNWRWENRVFASEPAQAAALYQQYFDQPIVEAEKETVVRAARSTWMPDQAQANWLAVDDREIWLARQEVTISEQGDWAEVEIYEVYQNQTALNQEVVYYFSLPETAVLTGVWLGDSEDRSRRFVYQVAPRGAAQTTYRSQVQRNIDPALLEQIGPSQYRLRVFPVEPMRWQWENNTNGRGHSILTDGPPMHMWLTYQVMAKADGWPLPYLARKYNVYWDRSSERLLNGAPLNLDNETWLPVAVPLTTRVTPTAHRVDFPNGRSVLVLPAAALDQPQPTGNLHLAVVINRSRSMADLASEVDAALAELAAWGTADLYLTVSPFHGEGPSRLSLADLEPDHLFYFGGMKAADLLAQFGELYAGESYDAIFVLTDGSGYELGEADAAIPVPHAPVWMVHLNGRFPIGYDDNTLAAVQASGGGSVTNIGDGLVRLLVGEAGQSDLVDGYVWQVMETAVAPTEAVLHMADAPFASLAARRLILAEMSAGRGQITELAALDALHELATTYNIVTPYSSMIVLVNNEQRRLLERLTAQDDRFERVFEELGNTQPPPLVTGVPEPEEWLLLGLALAALGWIIFGPKLGQNRRFGLLEL
jgi:putative PEP-CTERM system integral membrane protein